MGVSFCERLSSVWHRRALNVFMFIVLAHWAEHLAQAYQVYALGWPRPQAGGFFGFVFSVAREFRAHALRLRDRDAGWSLDTAKRVLWNFT